MRNHGLDMQENLAIERDLAAAAASEARRMSQELAKEKEYALIAVTEAGEKNQKLQEFLERESSKIMHAVAVVQQEKDAASHAASEATSSALKAGEMLSEVLNSFNTEMAKARTMSLQLQVVYFIFSQRVSLEQSQYETL
jgi:alanyl-tRNA synthetase